jgi:hypothetical protein
MDNDAGITIGELKVHLSSYNDDDMLYMGGLLFNRLKRRGDKAVHIEFDIYQKGENGELTTIPWSLDDR